MDLSVTKTRKTAPKAGPAAAALHRPMRGRPTAGQVSSIDRSIVDAALTMFLTDGFDAVGMKQVAEKACVSKGTLYSRYASKEALFTAVIEHSIDQWSAEASQGDLMLTDDIEQRLRHHATTIATWLGRPDVLALHHLVLSMRDRFPALADVMRRRGYDYIVGVIARDIEEAAARGYRNLRDPEAVARLLVGGITGAHMQERSDSNGTRDLHVFGQRVVDILIFGADGW